MGRGIFILSQLPHRNLTSGVRACQVLLEISLRRLSERRLINSVLKRRVFKVMRRNNNVIVKDVSKRNNNNVNDIEPKYGKSRQIEMELAPKLAKMIGANADSMPFLYKCFWKLSEHRVWQNAETAQGGKNPMALFIYLCKRDGV